MPHTTLTRSRQDYLKAIWHSGRSRDHRDVGARRAARRVAAVGDEHARAPAPSAAGGARAGRTGARLTPEGRRAGAAHGAASPHPRDVPRRRCWGSTGRRCTRTPRCSSTTSAIACSTRSTGWSGTRRGSARPPDPGRPRAHRLAHAHAARARCRAACARRCARSGTRTSARMARWKDCGLVPGAAVRDAQRAGPLDGRVRDRGRRAARGHERREGSTG